MEWLINLLMDNITLISGIMVLIAYIYMIYLAMKDVDK